MLLQFPILFAMFRFFPASIELRQQKFLWADDLSSYDSILDFGFNTLGLRRIEARYMADNESSRRVMEKVGMVFEGIRRDALLLDGVYISVGTCAILNDEFKYRS